MRERATYHATYEGPCRLHWLWQCAELYADLKGPEVYLSSARHSYCCVRAVLDLLCARTRNDCRRDFKTRDLLIMQLSVFIANTSWLATCHNCALCSLYLYSIEDNDESPHQHRA